MHHCLIWTFWVSQSLAEEPRDFQQKPPGENFQNIFHYTGGKESPWPGKTCGEETGEKLLHFVSKIFLIFCFLLRLSCTIYLASLFCVPICLFDKTLNSVKHNFLSFLSYVEGKFSWEPVVPWLKRKIYKFERIINRRPFPFHPSLMQSPVS